MTRLRRGFKAEAERLALSVRERVGAGPFDRLDPAALADHCGLRVVMLSQLAGADERIACAVEHLLEAGAEVLSALTVADRGRCLMVVNDACPPTRQRSAIAHELAHVLLGHEPSVLDAGTRSRCAVTEAEADWLGAAILIPKGAAIGAAVAGLRDHAVAARYGVSTALARWRLNATGARLVAARMANR